MLEPFLGKVAKFNEVVAHLKRDNAELKGKIKDLQGRVAGPTGLSGNVRSRVGLRRNSLVCIQLLPRNTRLP
jgi:hypothetical protein